MPRVRAAYQQAIESGDHRYAPEAAYNLGCLLYEAGDMASARTAFERAIASRQPRSHRRPKPPSTSAHYSGSRVTSPAHAPPSSGRSILNAQTWRPERRVHSACCSRPTVTCGALAQRTSVESTLTTADLAAWAARISARCEPSTATSRACAPPSNKESFGRPVGRASARDWASTHPRTRHRPRLLARLHRRRWPRRLLQRSDPTFRRMRKREQWVRTAARTDRAPGRHSASLACWAFRPGSAVTLP